MAEITINLTRRDEVDSLGAEQLVQQEALQKFGKLLCQALQDAPDPKTYYSSLDPFEHIRCRRHTAITLHGGRGSGKTTLLNSLIQGIRQNRTDLFPNLNELVGLNLNEILVLGIIDPSLVEAKENVLITIICLIKNAGSGSICVYAICGLRAR